MLWWLETIQKSRLLFFFLVHLEGEKFKEIHKFCAEWKVVP